MMMRVKLISFILKVEMIVDETFEDSIFYGAERNEIKEGRFSGGRCCVLKKVTCQQRESI
jgi:hypothetical protein